MLGDLLHLRLDGLDGLPLLVGVRQGGLELLVGCDQALEAGGEKRWAGFMDGSGRGLKGEGAGFVGEVGGNRISEGSKRRFQKYIHIKSKVVTL